MENYVITVSRMFGSRGHEIAARLGELLQIPVYDRSSVEALVPDPGSLQNAGTEGEHSGRAEETGAAPQSFMARLFRRDTRDHAAEEAQAMFNAQAEVIRGLAEQHMTMIIVTHEMAFARDVSTRVIFMDEGLVCEQGTPDQVFGHPQRERTRQFLQPFAQR